MVIDASALVAILRSEVEQSTFTRALSRAPVKRISPVNWHETAIATEKTGDFGFLEAIMARYGIVITPIDEKQARLAHQAWLKFGKGRHPARLNLGDCFAYALAKMTGEPLLFKGGDFARTDITAAV
jgi:ribonuclease VapC